MKKLLLSKALFTLVILALFASSARAQVPVAPLRIDRAQFLSSTGVPLAGGCVSFFATGTSTPQAIYADSTGTSQLPNPLTLDAAGEASVWLSNIGYDIVANAGVSGQLCSVSLGTQLWRENNKNPFSIINGSSNYIVASGTVDPSGVAGELAYRSDIPCFRGFTTFWDCFVTLTSTQTLLNKTFTSPVINNASGATLISPSIVGQTIGSVVSSQNNPTNFTTYTNDTTTGTVLNGLTKLKVLGSGTTAVSTSAGDTGGFEGIAIAGAGTSGSVMIQKSGQVLCIFDGSTTALDYVQGSLTGNNSCHDTGSTVYPTSGGQVLGRVLTTNAGAGTYLMELFPPEIRPSNGANVVCTNSTPVTITNNNAAQNLMSCSIPANALAAGSLLDVNLVGVESTASAMTLTFVFTVGGGTACTVTTAGTGVANNQPWNGFIKFAVLTAGAGGTANMSCGYSSSSVGGGIWGPAGGVGTPTFSVNTTVSNTLQVTVQMSVANAGNSTTEQLLKAVVF